MEVNYTKVLARNLLLTFLAFTAIFAVAALFLYDNITKKLADISHLVNNVEQEQKKPERVLLLLQEAESYFQQSLTDPGDKNKINYQNRLSAVFNEVDALLNTDKQAISLSPEQSKKVKEWRQKRIRLSKEFFVLKHDLDSLRSVYENLNSLSNLNIPVNNVAAQPVKITAPDTIQKIIPAKKRSFFKRLKAAILNKDSAVSTRIIEIRAKEINPPARNELIEAKRYRSVYAKTLKQLQDQNAKVLGIQGKLIALNAHISDELKRINSSVKAINSKMDDDLQAIAFRNYRETTELLNKVHLAALIFVLLFAGLLIIFINRLNISEKLLRKENERSVTIAQQKMDLLHHMSHEIRNPLNAIKSFLYMFSKSGLSKKQEDMLDAVKQSSDMLLQTLDDTLDAAKMENSEFKINKDPFNPNETLSQIIETMSYSAAKKQLRLNYQYKGDQNTIVQGDSFRLRQIIVNLLSNAIKYTAEGEVELTAELNTENNRLYVKIQDTGVGISPEQQSNLFSKYYQTNSAKGQIGTGLGLFICKQLVELQGGKIQVKSIPDVGSTFSFYIPYQPSESLLSVNVTEDEKTILPKGLNILAVDDNEINLSLLKMMMSKWNVNFYKASNGLQAMDIISRHEINIVLTDIHMPLMNGYELLSAISALGKPFNQLPVIFISGDSKTPHLDKLDFGNFSGLIRKPVSEKILIEHLLRLINERPNAN